MLTTGREPGRFRPGPFPVATLSVNISAQHVIAREVQLGWGRQASEAPPPHFVQPDILHLRTIAFRTIEAGSHLGVTQGSPEALRFE